MGGVAKTVGKGVGAIATGGLSLAMPHSIFGKAGDVAGGIATGGLSGGFGSLGGGGDINAPTIGGKQDPLSMLSMSGGAPLLMNISLGAGVDDSLSGFLGIPKERIKFMADNDPSPEGQAVRALRNQLNSVQSDTNLKNQAVQKLANDFPNIMAQKIPQYSAMADDATKQAMSQAMDAISAKQASGGMFSSGATAQAAAKAGAAIGMDKLDYGTKMAYQDFSNQYNQATGLQSFQQKMLGQGAAQGFNAVQNALQRNAGIDTNQANLNMNANQANQQSSNAMFGTLGQLGGTVIGGMFGGPMGASIGGSIGGSMGGGAGAPRLNTGFLPMPPPANTSQYAPYGVRSNV